MYINRLTNSFQCITLFCPTGSFIWHMTTIIRSRKANEQKQTGITILQLILDYGAFTFSTLDKRDIATWRQWVPTSCLLLREAIFGFLKM